MSGHLHCFTLLGADMDCCLYDLRLALMLQPKQQGLNRHTHLHSIASREERGQREEEPLSHDDVSLPTILDIKMQSYLNLKIVLYSCFLLRITSGDSQLFLS